MIRTLALRMAAAAALALLAAGFISMRGADAATLKRSVVVDADVVTLGDLFEGAGPFAAHPVFRAPELGVDGALPVGAALGVARAAGLGVAPAPDFASVSVVRRSIEISADALRDVVATAAAARLGVATDDVAVTFESDPAPVVADAIAREPVVVDTLNLQTGSGRFQATLSIDVGSQSRRIDLRGRAAETMSVPVLTRPLARRDVIAASDVTMARLERRFLGANVVLDSSEVVGLAARRALRAGEAIGSADVELPKLVTRGETVTLVFKKPGLALSARGRATSDGAKGGLISVLNEQSRRTIQGVVVGPGLVEVGASLPAPTVVATLKP